MCIVETILNAIADSGKDSIKGWAIELFQAEITSIAKKLLDS